MNFEEQLNIGIRYFDFRVAFLKGELHYLHAIYGDKVLPSLRIFKEYIIHHPTEIIILHFQKIYETDDDLKSGVLKKIMNIFGSMLKVLTRDLINSSLNKLRDQKIHILLIWADGNSISNKYVFNPYTESSNIEKVLDFVGNRIESYKNIKAIYVAQLILAPLKTKELISRFIYLDYSSLKKITKLAEKRINQYVITAGVKFRVIMRDFVKQEYSHIAIKRNFY